MLIVGAGLSGIGAGHYIQTKCPWASYAIFEARGAMGGTWDLFRYPGIRSDSDMFTLGYSFRPWPGKKTIADGPSILQYIKDTAAESGVDRQIRFHHRIVTAEWSSKDSLWEVTAEKADPESGEVETVHLTCGFLFSCSGYYRYDHGYQPEFPGMADFKGEVIHPQLWPEDLDYAGKKVVVIGSGATAVTLVPAMAKDASHVTMLQRSPTYVVSVPERSPIAKGLRKILPDHRAGSITRWILAMGTQGSYFLSKRNPELVKKVLRKGLERELPPGYDIDTHFTPTYNPWDQRLCAVPDGDLFKSLSDGSSSIVTGHIDTFTETGVRLTTGEEIDADIIVTATGLELLFLGGIDLVVDDEKVDVSERLVYKGMMLEGVPNLAIAVGYTNASWTLKADLTSDYVTRLLAHMRATGKRKCTPVNDDPSMDEAPLLGLDAGYIQRSADRFPKAGSQYPWRVYQNYFRDYRVLKKSDIEDGTMRFSSPS